MAASHSPTSGLYARGPRPQVTSCEMGTTWGWEGLIHAGKSCWEGSLPGCLQGLGSQGKSLLVLGLAPFNLSSSLMKLAKVLEAEASPGGWRQRRLQPAWRALIPTAEGPIPLTTSAAASSTQPVGCSPTSLAGPPCTEAN